jgi:menaquinone-dependent protoporphyrinogen oxidase
MTLLVAFASKHGATEELARSIAATLEGQQLDVTVGRMEEVEDVEAYDAFVLGSAIYMGSWLREARGFVDEHVETLAHRPTWLFSSGPIGSPPHPAASDSFNVPDLLATTHARGHKVFGGRLDKGELALSERALAGALRVPSGDFRDWEAVTAWALEIAHGLESEAAAPPAQ